MNLSNKTILLTGGTGSLGTKFTEIALKEENPKTIRIFSRGEVKQQIMRKSFSNDQRLHFFIGDVRDRERLYRVMVDVDIVVHTAALKQVTTCEFNPIEAIRTNIEGAINVIDAAIDSGTEKVIAIGTDKGVHPINLYGATKLVAEKLFIQANSYAGTKRVAMSCMRYGNVIGSRGSVIPIFQRQRKQGIITITDEGMTRFWITQEQAVRFIIACIGRMKGGEIFIPKIPSMRIIDLAKIIAPHARIKITGIKPGEKINEVLLTEEESRHSREFDDHFVIEPEHLFWSRKSLKGGWRPAEGFRYTSDSNERWLEKEDFKRITRSGYEK